MIPLLIIGAGAAYGLYKFLSTDEKEDKKPIIKQPEKIPLNKLPSKIGFSDDIKGAKKAGWKEGAMPMEFRHYWLWDDKWKEITKDEFDFLHIYSGGHDDKFEYSKKKAGMEDGKHVSYKIKQSQ